MSRKRETRGSHNEEVVLAVVALAVLAIGSTALAGSADGHSNFVVQ